MKAPPASKEVIEQLPDVTIQTSGMYEASLLCSFFKKFILCVGVCVCGGGGVALIFTYNRGLSVHTFVVKIKHCQQWMSTVVGDQERAPNSISKHMGIGPPLVGVIPSPRCGD